LDLSVFKSTSISERTRLEFRAESFNLLNRTNLGLPNPIVFSGGTTSPSAGIITSTPTTSPPIQFALKLVFLRRQKKIATAASEFRKKSSPAAAARRRHVLDRLYRGPSGPALDAGHAQRAVRIGHRCCRRPCRRYDAVDGVLHLSSS